MMIKENELLNLDDEEKLAIINLLQSSLYNNDYKISGDQQHLVEERLEKIQKGESKFYNAVDFQDKLKKRKS